MPTTIHVRRVLFGLILALAAGLPSVAQETNSAANAHQLFQSAFQLQMQAGRLKDPAQAIDLLQRAISLYSAALQAQPTFHDGWWKRGQCRQQLADLTQNPEDRRRLLTAALADFTKATQLPDADWNSWRGLGYLLNSHVELLSADLAGRQPLLRQARDSYLHAAPLAKLKSQQSQTEGELAACLAQLAWLVPTPVEQQALREEALRRFSQVGASWEVSANAWLLGLWGMTLSELRKSTHDPAFTRQAIEKLSAAVELEPANLITAYNLACQYALNNQMEEAIRILSRCLNDRSQGTYFRRLAADDPDFTALRQTTAYAQLIKTAPPGGTGTGTGAGRKNSP